MIASCQPRNPPAHATGMAAISARSGTTTKIPTRARCPVVACSSAKSDRGARMVARRAAPASPAGAGTAGGGAITSIGGDAIAGRTSEGAMALSAEVVIVLLAVVGGLSQESGPSLLDAYVTVTYETVS